MVEVQFFHIVSLWVRAVQKRTAVIMSLNACPPREKKVTHQHRSSTIERAAFQTTLHRWGDREAGNMQSDRRKCQWS